MAAYRSKHGSQVAEYNPLEWIAAPVSYIPDREGHAEFIYIAFFINKLIVCYRII